MSIDIIEETSESNGENSRNSFEVRLDTFEGPIDLLLHLVNEQKLDIQTLKLADITEGYLSYMKQLDELNMDNASEFIEIAATLMEIKSKRLLPVLDEYEEEELENKEQQIIGWMKEREILLKASEKLKTLEEINRFYKQPDKNAYKFRVVIKDMKIDNLVKAFANILANNLEKQSSKLEEKKIDRDRFTVAEKIAAIKDAILIKERIFFTELVAKDQTKSEIINIFLALLELLKTQVVKAVQVGNFSNIEIIRNTGENNANE